MFFLSERIQNFFLQVTLKVSNNDNGRITNLQHITVKSIPTENPLALILFTNDSDSKLKQIKYPLALILFTSDTDFKSKPI